jgi:hypothetical protein
MNIISIIWLIVVALATLWSAIFLSGRLSANIDLRIQPIWSVSRRSILKLVIEIENTGSVRVGVDRVLLSIKQHDLPSPNKPGNCIGSEWVDFSDAVQIFTSTLFINPAETLHIERLYDAENCQIFHVGLQIYLRYPWYVNRLGPQVRSYRFTRTFYIIKPDKFQC